MGWSVAKIEGLVRLLVPQVLRVVVSFPEPDTVRVLVICPDIKGVHYKVHTTLARALPDQVRSVQVQVVKGGVDPM